MKNLPKQKLLDSYTATKSIGSQCSIVIPQLIALSSFFFIAGHDRNRCAWNQKNRLTECNNARLAHGRRYNRASDSRLLRSASVIILTDAHRHKGCARACDPMRSEAPTVTNAIVPTDMHINNKITRCVQFCRFNTHTQNANFPSCKAFDLRAQTPPEGWYI